ncbi:hypothetical protein [Paraburkholderia sp. CNPSo 3281]|nr:hypothetical protein [Paraburkholderia sp. CNPSo 3281]
MNNASASSWVRIVDFDNGYISVDRSTTRHSEEGKLLFVCKH